MTLSKTNCVYYNWLVDKTTNSRSIGLLIFQFFFCYNFPKYETCDLQIYVLQSSILNLGFLGGMKKNIHIPFFDLIYHIIFHILNPKTNLTVVKIYYNELHLEIRKRMPTQHWFPQCFRRSVCMMMQLLTENIHILKIHNDLNKWTNSAIIICWMILRGAIKLALTTRIYQKIVLIIIYFTGQTVFYVFFEFQTLQNHKDHSFLLPLI